MVVAYGVCRVDVFMSDVVQLLWLFIIYMVIYLFCCGFEYLAHFFKCVMG